MCSDDSAELIPTRMVIVGMKRAERPPDVLSEGVPKSRGKNGGGEHHMSHFVDLIPVGMIALRFVHPVVCSEATSGLTLLFLRTSVFVVLKPTPAPTRLWRTRPRGSTTRSPTCSRGYPRPPTSSKQTWPRYFLEAIFYCVDQPWIVESLSWPLWPLMSK